MKLSSLPEVQGKWASRFRETSYSYRKTLVGKIISKVKNLKSGDSVYKNIKSGELELIGVVTCVPCILVDRFQNASKMTEEYVWQNKTPSLLYHVKDSCILVLINPNTQFSLKLIRHSSGIVEKSDPNLPKSELAWVPQILKAVGEFRSKLVQKLIEGIKEFKTKKKPDIGKQIYNEITSDRLKLLGIATCLPYIKVDGSEDERQMEYVHAFGMPTLLYHVRKTPMYILVNPALRFNSNILKEIEKNQYKEDVKGITS